MSDGKRKLANVFGDDEDDDNEKNDNENNDKDDAHQQGKTFFVLKKTNSSQ